MIGIDYIISRIILGGSGGFLLLTSGYRTWFQNMVLEHNTFPFLVQPGTFSIYNLTPG